MNKDKKCEDCDKPVFAVRWCHTHYCQAERDGRYTPRRIKQRTRLRDDKGRKLCLKCDTWKPESDFHKGTSNKDGLQTYCRICFRDFSRERKYKLNPGGVDELLRKQDGKCAACGEVLVKFHVDHDHACCSGAYSCGTCVRGLLCGRCNWVAGVIETSALTVAAVKKYLDRRKGLETMDQNS